MVGIGEVVPTPGSPPLPSSSWTSQPLWLSCSPCLQAVPPGCDRLHVCIPSHRRLVCKLADRLRDRSYSHPKSRRKTWSQVATKDCVNYPFHRIPACGLGGANLGGVHVTRCIVYMWRREVAVQNAAPHSPPRDSKGNPFWDRWHCLYMVNGKVQLFLEKVWLGQSVVLVLRVGAL